MRVIVCGGRDFGLRASRVEQEWIRDCLNKIFHSRFYDDISKITIVTGGAHGVDSVANWWAVNNKIKTEVHHAEWIRYGNKAGPIRNKKMLDAGADLVIAFLGGSGTDNMKSIARKAGVEVLEVGSYPG